MRKVLAGFVAATLLVFAPAADAAVTLDPGTKLTVVCEDKQPFRGQPFERMDTGESLRRAPVFGAPRTMRWWNDTLVRVTRRGNHERLIRVGSKSVIWRGC